MLPSLIFGTPTRRPSQIQFLQMARGEPAQIGFAGGDAVLQRGLAGFGQAQDFIQQRACFGDRQRRVVGEAGGERNQFGPRQCGVHKPRDWRLDSALTQL